MARGRLHRTFFLYYLAVIACFAGVTLWLAPAATLHAVAGGGAASASLAAPLAFGSAWSLGRALESLSRSMREMTAGRLVRPADVRARRSGSIDELGDLAGALAELSTHYEEALGAARGEEQRLRLVLDGMSEG